jgi:thioredoxin-like negative regulator of GroEL
MKKIIRNFIFWFVFGFVMMSSVSGQDATDKDFKDKTSKGFVVVKFTSKWQGSKLDDKLFDGVKGHEDAKVITVASEDAKKVCKKLRLRNFPSIVLFHDGKKKEAWKADMDGENDVSNIDIKKAISDAMSGDVY